MRLLPENILALVIALYYKGENMKCTNCGRELKQTNPEARVKEYICLSIGIPQEAVEYEEFVNAYNTDTLVLCAVCFAKPFLKKRKGK